ncbi:glycosyltransferase family 4 protein [Geobacter pickeringii]|uniref:glycosyltransferase family 4 protein n=1 Tax=Geobacter pickeringii TaxID=345632 RepID=UPI00130DF8A2|nr:glycosyltransferase family 4 protein [Geobacter pickeringii]
MKKVVILQKYIAPYRIPLFNGIARHPDVELTLVYYGKPEARRRWSFFAGREFSEVQARCVSVNSGYERNMEFPHSLYADLVRLRPDFVICAPDMGGIATGIYSWKHETRYAIWSEAIPATEGRVSLWKKKLRQRLYRNAESFIVPGSLSETYIRAFCPTAQFHHAPNTVEEERFSLDREGVHAKFAGERLIVTFSGSLIERKGILLLLEAFIRVLREHPELRETCQLRVLGTGPLDISDFNDENIEVVGFCEQDAYAAHLRESHIFVLPSLHDNNPLTVVEGLFAGNVIVVTAGVGNHPEAVHGNGSVVSSGSADELAQALERLVTLPRAELLGMACNSLDIAHDFSVARSVDGFLAAIRGNSTECCERAV